MKKIPESSDMQELRFNTWFIVLLTPVSSIQPVDTVLCKDHAAASAAVGKVSLRKF